MRKPAFSCDKCKRERRVLAFVKFLSALMEA